MAGNSFDATIAAIDKFSAPLKAIAERMKGLIDTVKGVNKASEDGSKLHSRFLWSLGAHYRLLGEQFQGVSGHLAGLRSQAAAVLPVLSALGVGGSLVGLFKLTQSTAEATLATDALLKKIQMAGKDFGGLAFAAKMTGVEVDSLSPALIRFAKNLELAAVGKNKDLAELFKHLHIPLRDAHGQMRSVAELMPHLADALKNTTDPAMRIRMAMALFGKTGADLLPMLVEGRQELERYAEAGKKFGYFAPESEKKALKDFQRSWIELDAAVGAFKKQIGSQLAPVLLPVVQMVRDLVNENRKWLAGEIVAKVKQLADWVRELKFDNIVKSLSSFVHQSVDFIQAIGGVRTIIGALTLMLGSPLIAAVTNTITVFVALGKTLFVLGAIMWANPILAAIGAVAVGGFLLWRYWKEIKQGLVDIWAGISRSIDAAWRGEIKPMFDAFAQVPAYLNQAWQWVKGKFADLWAWFSNLTWVQKTIDAIRPFYDYARQLVQAWQPVKQFFADLWDSITGLFRDGYERIRPIIDALRDAASFFRDLALPGAQAAPGGGGGAGGQEPIPVVPRRPRPQGPLPRLFDPSSAPAGSGGSGAVDINVNFQNLPSGAQVQTQQRGAVPGRVTTDVGYADPMGFAY